MERNEGRMASSWQFSFHRKIIAFIGNWSNIFRDYAKRRMAFGRSVCKHPLHMNTLMTLETSVRGCTILMLELARLMGLEEAGKASEQDAMVLRVMMPVAKAFTAKLAVANTSEGLECFGGQVSGT